MPVAAATAAPPLVPPGVISGFQGLRVMPVSGVSVTPFQPNSGVVVLPSSTAPCSRRRATAGASSFQAWLRSTRLGAAQGRPALGDQQVLHGRRHAIHQAPRFATLPALFGLPRRRQRARFIDEAIDVELLVVPADLRQRRLGGLDRRELLLLVGLEQIDSRHESQFG